jgi:hypothetical protein
MENEKIKDKQPSVLLSFLALLLCIIVLAGIALFIYDVYCFSTRGLRHLFDFYFDFYYAILGLSAGLVIGLIKIMPDKTGKNEKKSKNL